MATDAPEINDQSQATVPPSSAPDAAVPAAPGADPDDPDAAAQPAAEIRMPTRKDVSLRELLNKIDDCAPIVRFHQPEESSFKTVFMSGY
jgi:hypothetical protein